MRELFLLFFIALFLGCETLAPTHSKNATMKKNTLNQQDMIRGVIASQYYIKSNNAWGYKLEVRDVLNEDLRYFSFTYPKKLHRVGDLVYVVYSKNDKTKIQNLYLIKKSAPHKVKKEDNKTKLKKRTKSQKAPWIKPPKTETINLN